MSCRVLPLALTLSIGIACAPGSDGGPEASDAPRIVQPGAPGEDTRVLSAAELATLPGVVHTAADVRFMREMIPHHAQALEMVALIDGRSTSEQIASLGQRIAISQTDEIASMRQWLTARGETPPAEAEGHAHMAGQVPGMLNAEQMAELAAAQGTAFDVLFLRYMIQHHEGAIVMVRDLMASPSAAQESEVFAFAADVEADQQMEIDRMSGMLREME